MTHVRQQLGHICIYYFLKCDKIRVFQRRHSIVFSFSFVLLSYVLLTSLCINVFAFYKYTFCINVTHSVFCTTYVLLLTHCSLFM
jgi:hypothetical protein